MVLLDEVMPGYDRRERHSRKVDPSLPDLWQSVREVTADELRLTRALMTIRTLGRRPDKRGAPLLQGFRKMGFRELADQPGRELVLGGIGRFWQLSGGLVKVESPEHFADFDEPGYAKVAFNLRLDGDDLSTETRILGTDATARRNFGRYWLLVRPGSGLIRREWLRAIEKRAQRPGLSRGVDQATIPADER